MNFTDCCTNDWNFEFARTAKIFKTKFTNRLKKMSTFSINVCWRLLFFITNALNNVYYYFWTFNTSMVQRRINHSANCAVAWGSRRHGPRPVAGWIHFGIGAGVRYSASDNGADSIPSNIAPHYKPCGCCELMQHVLMSLLYMIRKCTERLIYS